MGSSLETEAPPSARPQTCVARLAMFVVTKLDVYGALLSNNVAITTVRAKTTMKGI
jgi:hypothetical protein